MVVEGSPSAWAVAWQYLQLGVAHILLGFDHLLFVLARLLIVRGWRRLLATVTAFKVAHSITLAAAMCVYAPAPSRPRGEPHASPLRRGRSPVELVK